MSERPAGPLTQSQIRSVVTGLMLTILLGALDQTIVSVSLPMMSADLEGGGLLAWVVSGYLIAVAVSTPVYGKLGDLYGRRLMLSAAIAIFLLASVACALAQSMPMLVGARIVQGLGGGGLISIAQATIADVVSPRERGRYQGYISSAFAMASVSGPLAGGLLTQYLSWRWIFWINLPLGLLALWVSRRALASLPVPRVKRPIDYPGALLLTAGLSCLLIAVTLIGQGSAWADTRNVQLFAGAALLLMLFTWQERRAREPIVPLSLLANRTVAICSSLLFIAFVQVIALSVLIPMRLQMLTDMGADGAALRLLPMSLAVPCGAYIGGKLATRSGHVKPILLGGTALVPLSIAALALVDPRNDLLGILLMVCAGLGLGLQFPTSTVAVQNAVPHRHVGIATSLTAFSRSLGAATGIAILMALLLATLQTHVLLPSGASTGSEIIRTMVAGASAGLLPDEALFASVHRAFGMVLAVSAGVAASSFLLASLLSDDALAEEAPSLQ